jgi:hypothetical protein
LLIIYYNTVEGEDMTDHIAYNLGDFFNAVRKSKDPVLKKSYSYQSYSQVFGKNKTLKKKVLILQVWTNLYYKV